MMKETIEFPVDFSTGRLRPIPLMRINLASGVVARTFLYPDGIHIMVPETSIDNGDIILADVTPYMGIGDLK